MSRSFTKAQQSAINTRDRSLLVSAAAGSGKTTTLTERIISSLTSKESSADISRMLVVTFTKASASDLKEKISKELTKALGQDPSNRHLAKQLLGLGSAQISTIDSFYYSVVKNNFQKLSLPIIPRVADDTEFTALSSDIMEETVNSFYLNSNNFEEFMDNFSSLSNPSLPTETFISVYEKLLCKKKGIHALKDFENELSDASSTDFFKTKYGDVTLQYAKAFADYAIAFYNSAIDVIKTDEKAVNAYYPLFDEELSFLFAFEGSITEKNYEKARELLNNFPQKKLKPIKNKNAELDALKETRKSIKSSVKKLFSDHFQYTQSEISRCFSENARICSGLHTLLCDFDKRFMAEKRAKGSFSFSDMRRFVFELFCEKDGTPTPLALEYRERFDYIYIDEYQDVDDVQDAIFSLISKPDNRFMVGDIKQSIYGFRNANPDIFAEYKRSLPMLNGCYEKQCSLFMSENFRCDENVIKFSNAISSFLFSNDPESIGYTKEDDLIFSKKNISENYISAPVTIALTGIHKGADKPDDSIKSADAEYVTNEIKRLVLNEKLDGGKPIGYGNIAVLVRNKAGSKALEEKLAAAGIPFSGIKENDLLENPEVLLVLSLLNTIDNPQRDIPLAGSLRSPIFGFSLDELIEIRHAADPSASLYDALLEYSKGSGELSKKCSHFNENLLYWRKSAAMSPCHKLIKKLYKELSLLSYAKNGRKNLLKLYDYAIKFESSGFKGLYGFVKYISELISHGTKLSDKAHEDDRDKVQIMTIHRSKGLEFPVCFLYKCETPLNTSDNKGSIVYSQGLGIGFKLHDKTGLAEYSSPLLSSISKHILSTQLQEEMRVLYVAMTRARERLYVVANLSATNKTSQKTINSKRMICSYNKNFAILSSKSYIEWIMMALDMKDENDFFNTQYIYYEPSIPSQEDIPSSTEDFSITSKASSDEQTKALIQSRFNYVYPYEHISSLPAKLSVSALSPKVLDLSDNGSSTLEQLYGDFDEQFAGEFDIPDSLEGVKALSGAERGTATHAFLQFCDFERTEKVGIQDELSRLCENKFIPKSYFDAVNRKQLEGFFKSTLFSRMKKAQKIWREQRFNIFLPASEFTEIEEKATLLKEETIAVQGVMDIFFIDEHGKIVLCDYKTDYLTKAELASPATAAEKLTARHKQQLSYYSRAIEKMFGKTPDEVLIYSLPLGDCVNIELKKMG